jgi:hypothetical protein
MLFELVTIPLQVRHSADAADSTSDNAAAGMAEPIHSAARCG